MDKVTLIKNLNQDLANELSAIAQYITYAAKTTGPFRPQLSQFFLEEVARPLRASAATWSSSRLRFSPA